MNKKHQIIFNRIKEKELKRQSERLRINDLVEQVLFKSKYKDFEMVKKKCKCISSIKEYTAGEIYIYEKNMHNSYFVHRPSEKYTYFNQNIFLDHFIDVRESNLNKIFNDEV